MEDVVRTLIVGSPFGALLGLSAETIEPNRVSVRLPFRPEVVTVADVVHGGAISALIDTAATAAAWSAADAGENLRGTTIGFTVSFLNAACGQDVIATGRVLRRGSSIVFCDVEVAAADGTPVARALVTYKLG